MRLPLLFFFPLALFPVAVACSSTTTQPATADASSDEDAGEEPSDPPADAAIDTSVARDAGHDSGKLPFGQTCTSDGECDSNVCAPNDTGGPHWCSYRCTKTTQAMKCPTPETPGTCNTHGNCRNF